MGNARLISLCAGSALAYYGVRSRSRGGLVLAAIGGDLLYRAATEDSFLLPRLRPRQPAIRYDSGIRVDESVTIQRPPEDVYCFWRRVENLPQFLDHLESVQSIDGRRSHWVAKGPAGKKIEWDAEIISDVPAAMIGWKTLPGSDIDHAGSVRFERALDGFGTEVKVSLQYRPPGGAMGAAVGKLLGEDPARQVLEDLYRLKRLLEAEDVLEKAVGF